MTAKTVQFVRLMRIAKTGFVYPRFYQFGRFGGLLQQYAPRVTIGTTMEHALVLTGRSLTVLAVPQNAVFMALWVGGRMVAAKRLLFHCGSREILDVTNSPTYYLL